METAIVIEKGIAIGGKTLREHIELIDCARAINFITVRVQQQNNLSLDDILALHKIISDVIMLFVSVVPKEKDNC